MKARLKTTGDIIEVTQGVTKPNFWYTEDLYEYLVSMLDFNIPENRQGEIKGYVARDSDGDLYFYKYLPKRGKFYWEDNTKVLAFEDSIKIPSELFPHLTWESEPEEVILTVKKETK